MTVEIKLTKGCVAIIDDEDGDLASYKWTTVGNPIQYARRHKSKNVQLPSGQLHRIILSRMLSRPLAKTEYVDHIDHNGLNNRRINLRLATPAQNQQNRRMSKNNTSGYRGVRFNALSGRWEASIGFNGKHIRLGSFHTAREAYAAYLERARVLFGEFLPPDTCDEETAARFVPKRKPSPSNAAARADTKREHADFAARFRQSLNLPAKAA